MALYRNIVRVKEAFKVGRDDLPQWFTDAIDKGLVEQEGWGGYRIRTLEGNMLADKGDYVIKGLYGELYPCKSNIFEDSYERVDGQVVSERSGTVSERSRTVEVVEGEVVEEASLPALPE
jgi:hypothetical protein